jgi:translation initiation factor 3 subunit D
MRMQVLATELKNNANKLAKWTAQALLSGADQVCTCISAR